MSQGNSKQPASKNKYKKAINIACGVVAMSSAIVFVIALVFALLGPDPDVAKNDPGTSKSGATTAPNGSGGSSTTKKKVITGKVTMADTKKPVAGAQVRMLTRAKGATQATTQIAVTNAKGVFTFDKIGEGNHRVMGYYKEYASRAKRYQGQGVSINKQNIIVPLFKVPSIKVKVVSSKTKQPIKDAEVRNLQTDGETIFKTDANGLVTIHGLTPERWTLQVSSGSHAVVTKGITLSGTETADIAFELEPGAVLYGEVRDEKGLALSNVNVGVSREQIQSYGFMKTDKNGKFRFPHVPVTSLNVTCIKDGFNLLQQSIVMTVETGKEQELKLTLIKRPDGGSVAGVVSDAAGKVIAGAEITNQGRSSRDVRKAITGADGSFQLDDVMENWQTGHELMIRSKGHASKQVSFTPGKRESPTELKITLEPGHRIQGLVVDEAGKGISDVSISSTQNATRVLGRYIKTDKQGKFAIDGLPAKCTFTMRKNGYSTINSKPLPLNGSQAVKVTMLSAGIIRGRVVDSVTGKIVTPYLVRVKYSPERTREDPVGSLGGVSVTGNGQEFSNQDGGFQLDNYTRNMPLQVTVVADGYHHKVERRVVAKAAGESKVVEFRLSPIDESTLLSFSGQLLNEKAEPIQNVELRLIVADKRLPGELKYPFHGEVISQFLTQQQVEVQQFLIAVSDENGKFQFNRVLPGKEIDLAYWGNGISRDQLSQLETMSEKERIGIKINVVTPGRLIGKINREIYPTVKRISLNGARNQAQFNKSISSSVNSFDLQNVPPGKYQLQLTSLERLSDNSGAFTIRVIKEISVEVKSGETLELGLGFEDNKPAL